VIGYIRVCRPGSVIGPQQNFVKEIQALMWHEGEVYRASHGPVPPMPVWGPARTAAAAVAAASATAKVGALYRSGSSNSMSGALGMKPGSAKRVTGEAAMDASSGLLAARGASAGFIRPPQAPTRSQGGASGGGAGTASKSITDLSLTQLQERLQNVALSGGGRASSASAVAPTVSTYTQSYSFNNNGSGSLNIRPAAAVTPSTGAVAASARAKTPTRQASSSTSSKGPLTTGLLVGRPSSQQLLARLSSGGNHGNNMLYGVGSSMGGNVHEQALNALLGGGSASTSSSNGSLRATLHTDTVTAANRPKVEPVGVVSQSSDFISAGWRSSGSSGAAAATPGMISANSGNAVAGGGGGSSARAAVQSKIARILAPNGQPRKVPAAALLAANDPNRAGAGALGAYY
jgi:hypothetical protein